MYRFMALSQHIWRRLAGWERVYLCRELITSGNVAGGLNPRLLKQDEQFDINHRKPRWGLMGLMADRQHTEAPYEPGTTWGFDSGKEFNPQRQTGNVYQYVGRILGQASILWVHKHFDRMLDMLKLAVATVATQTNTWSTYDLQPI